MVSPPRHGRARWGCLFSLALLAVAAWVGTLFGQSYLRFYNFRDGMRVDAEFAARKTDDAIRAHLKALADSLGLPDEAHNIGIRRHPGSITIWSEYDEVLDFRIYRRPVHFIPTAEGPL